MADGDLVVLRSGTTDVYGVGVIVGDYQWHDMFGDINGWDLQHVRRVRWLWKEPKEPQRFPLYTMKLGDTTQRLDAPIVREWLKQLQVVLNAEIALVVQLPELSDICPTSLEEISEFLFERGVASDSIETLVRQIGELTRIAKWYKKTDSPSESETVAYLVAPLLRALGWTPQKMAIEWN